MKPITKGIIKSGLSVTELIIGLVTGFYTNHLYSRYYQKHKNELKMNKSKTITVILMYTFLLCTICFIIRELNKTLLVNHIMNKMGYKVFQWPEPIMFGFGIIFFQDILKLQIKEDILPYLKHSLL